MKIESFDQACLVGWIDVCRAMAQWNRTNKKLNGSTPSWPPNIGKLPKVARLHPTRQAYPTSPRWLIGRSSSASSPAHVWTTPDWHDPTGQFQRIYQKYEHKQTSRKASDASEERTSQAANPIICVCVEHWRFGSVEIVCSSPESS